MWKISGWAFPHYGRSSSKAELALFISSQSDTWLHLGFSLITAEVWSIRLKRLHAFHPQGLLCFSGSGQRYGSKHFKRLMFNTFKAEVLENTKLTLWTSVIGTSWYSAISRNMVCYYCWQWRAETKPEHIFLKPYCSSQSGPGTLCSLASLKVARMNYITQTCQSRAVRGEHMSRKRCCYSSTRSFPFLTLPPPVIYWNKNPKPNKTKAPKTLTQKGGGCSFYCHFNGKK